MPKRFDQDEEKGRQLVGLFGGTPVYAGPDPDEDPDDELAGAQVFGPTRKTPDSVLPRGSVKKIDLADPDDESLQEARFWDNLNNQE